MTTPQFIDLDRTRSFAELASLPIPEVSRLLDPQRLSEKNIPAGAGLVYYYGAMPVDDQLAALLQQLADESGCIASYRSLVSGAVMNTGESRMVLHHLTRGTPGTEEESTDTAAKRAFYLEQTDRIREFSRKVHAGEVRGSTGKHFDTVVQIGIGGSDLGPRALCLALNGYAGVHGRGPVMRTEFISNVDPDDAAGVLSTLDLERTLFILVTKSGTTQETLTNYELVMRRMRTSGIAGIDPAAHLCVVTSETSPLAQSREVLQAFFIDDYIGGRFSSCSAVGGLVISLAFGHETFLELLAGSHEADQLAFNEDITHNAALMDALIGVYLRTIAGYPAAAVLPYSQALSRFPAHLQQLDMESNGKRVNRFGEPISYPTGPIIFGEPGTNGQHSFYQLLHQGTDIIPLQFIAFRQSQMEYDCSISGSTSQEKLLANLAAQIVAFAVGRSHSDHNRQFPGNRPSSLILGEQLTPRSLGALLAHYENKVMFQGFLWNINSFDQEGVQLGKVLTEALLSKTSTDALLSCCYDLMKQEGQKNPPREKEV